MGQLELCIESMLSAVKQFSTDAVYFLFYFDMHACVCARTQKCACVCVLMHV